MIVSISGYQVKLTLSEETAQAKIYLCTDANNRLYAIKVFFTLETMKCQAQNLQVLCHQNIIKMVDYQESAKILLGDGSYSHSPIIVLEYVEGGNLFDILDGTGRFPQSICKSLFVKMIEGLEYIHDRQISHRDIKPQNFLVSFNNGIKFADFGLSAKMSEQPYRIRVGTDLYWTPEMHEGRQYNGCSADIFGISMMLFMMFFGCRPFMIAEKSSKNYRIFMNQRTIRYWETFQKKTGPIPYELRQLFQKSFSYQPNNRLSLNQLKSCQWLRNGESIASDSQLKEFLLKRYTQMISSKDQSSTLVKAHQIYQNFSSEQTN